MVPCIWTKTMQKDSDLEELFPQVAMRRTLKRRQVHERTYTKEQYSQMIVIIRNLRSKYGNKEKRLDNTFKMYDEAIKQARDSVKYNDLYID